MTAPRLALSWLAGVVAAHFALEGQWAPVALAAIVALVPLLRRRRIPLAAAAAALFALGAARFALAQPDPPPLTAYNDGPAVTLRGVVSREPDVRGTSLRLWLDAEEILTPGGWAETDGGLLVTTTPRPLYAYGDLLEVSGELETPPVLEDFDYREYLARQGVYSTLRYPRITLVGTGQGRWWQGAVGQARRFLGEGLAESLPEPQAALAQGVFLGQRSALPPELRDDLNATGTSHLIVVSGYNVSLVAGMVTAGLAWMRGWPGCWAGAGPASSPWAPSRPTRC